LDPKSPGPAAASVDEHFRAFFGVGSYALVGCEPSNPESGGVLHAHAFGQFDDILSSVHDDVLGEGAEIGRITAAEDQVTWLETRQSGLDDGSCKVTCGYCGCAHLECSEDGELRELVVDRVDGRVGDFDKGGRFC
jgi:hypothetical protein